MQNPIHELFILSSVLENLCGNLRNGFSNEIHHLMFRRALIEPEMLSINVNNSQK